MACRAFWTGFYIWISILSEICTVQCSKFPSSSRVQNTHKSALSATSIFKTILGSVNTGVNTELQTSTIFWNINYQLRAHINGPQTPVNHFMHRVSPYPLIIFLKTFFGNCEYFDLLCIFCTLAIKARRLGKQRLPKDEWCYLGDEMHVFKDEWIKFIISCINQLFHTG